MGFDMYRRGGRGDDDGYYRLNVWGMSEAVPVLAELGIVRWAETPPFPKPEDFGLDNYPDDDEHPANAAEQAYLDAIKRWKEQPHGEGPGIPSYKFGSNDGWLVLPVEVQSGIRWADEHHSGWRETLAGEETSWIAQFVTWMEGSTEGFEVW